MRKKMALLCALLATTFSSLFAQVEQVQENGPGISRRLQHEINMTKDPALGYVPKDRLIQAYDQRRQQLQSVAGRAHYFHGQKEGQTLMQLGQVTETQDPAMAKPPEE